MCIVCVLLDKDKITRGEALKALWESINDAKSIAEEDHIRDLYAQLEVEGTDQGIDTD